MVSEYAFNVNDRVDETVGLLWLPAFKKPSDYQWPVHGLPVTCVLGCSDLPRCEDLARVLFEHDAAEVTCHIIDSNGDVLVKPCERGGAQ